MRSNEIVLDLKILNEIARELKTNKYSKVGVLGKNNTRQDANTNALIGMTQEFGSAKKNIPERSFLRMPLREQMPKRLNEIGKSVLLGLTHRNISLYFKKLGVLAEEIIQDAFDTKGFGKWEKLKKATIKRKGFDKILIQTTQLRKSITSEVKSDI